MDHNAGHGARRQRRRRPGTAPGAASLSAKPTSAEGPPPEPGSPAALHGLDSLERLRDRVELAAHELRRLREENAVLSSRLRELEARPAEAVPTGFTLDQDPELLRRKISGFIEAIDRYLEQESRQG